MPRAARRPSPPSSPDDTKRTAHEWESIREEFTRLYRQEGWFLPEIKALFAARGFHASNSAFYRKINKWKLEKNLKRDEALAILRKSRKMTIIGAQQPVFMVRDRQVTVDDAYRHFQNKGVRRDYWDEYDFDDCPTPPSVESLSLFGSDSGGAPTPVGSTDNAQLTATAEDRVRILQVQQQLLDDFLKLALLQNLNLPQAPPRSVEDTASSNLFLSTQYYYASRFEQKVWPLATIQHDIDDSAFPSVGFGGLFLEYHNMQLLKDDFRAQSVLSSALRMVDDLLQKQDLRLLTYFMEAIAFCRANGYFDVAHGVNAYIRARAIYFLGRNHPIYAFLDALLHAPDGTHHGFVELGLKSMLQQFRARLHPPYDLETMRLLLTGAMILKHQSSFTSALEFLGILLPMYRRSYGECSYQTVHCLVDMAHVNLSLHDYSGAMGLINHAQLACDGILEEMPRTESQLRIAVSLACLREMQGDELEKRRLLEDALILGRRVGLLEDHWQLRDLRARLA